MTCDFTAAFDTLNRHLIVQEMSRLGVRQQNLQWISSFLHDLKTTLTVGKEQRQVNITTGVPQGSIIGPLAFTCCTDALKSRCDSVLLLKYADDTAVAASISNLNDLARYKEAVHAVSTFANQRGLLLNAAKTQELIIDFRKPIPTENILTHLWKLIAKQSNAVPASHTSVS